MLSTCVHSAEVKSCCMNEHCYSDQIRSYYISSTIAIAQAFSSPRYLCYYPD